LSGADEPVPAGLLRRLGAMVYDALLIIALWMVTLFVLVALSNASVGGPFLQSLLFVELFAFFTYFWVFRGQTLGMLAWHLSITSTAGYRLSFTQVMLRLIGALVSFACLGTGYFWILIDPAKRAWPDLISDSIILYTPKQSS
jgi:uncharacterized RDD family membrane protein YckC